MSTRVEIFLTSVEIFHIFAIFLNSVYRVEISIRDENLHVISLLASNPFCVNETTWYMVYRRLISFA